MKLGKFYTPELILIAIVILLCETVLTSAEDSDADSDPHREPSLCEVCKYLTDELKGRLDETGKSHEVIETGYGFDKKKKRKKYQHSELRLIEAVNDPHICDKILQYNVHAERKGSLRFAKGRSETMDTLHGLVDKGVKVELGIPYDMWDTPSAGVTEMQRKCFRIVEEFEEDIEDWYYHNQDKDLTNFLCKDKVLKSNDQDCLKEVWTGKEKRYEDTSEEDKGDVKTEKPPKKNKKDKKGKKKIKGDEDSVDVKSKERGKDSTRDEL